MDPISTSYTGSSIRDAFIASRTQPTDSTSRPEQPAGQPTAPQTAPPNNDNQPGIQKTPRSEAEFQPYTSGKSNSNDKAGKPPAPAETKEAPKETPPPDTTQAAVQDPQTQQIIARLKSIEEKVKAHEAAHKSAGGAATGPISYSYTRGPDGKNYITGGEVPITISTGRTPQETISRMQQVIQAALAPADPSPQDRAVAAQAATIQQNARMEQASASNAKASDSEAPAADTPPSAAAPETKTTSPENDLMAAQQSRRAYSDPTVTGKRPDIESPASATNTVQDSAGPSRRDTTRQTTVNPLSIADDNSPIRPFSLYS